jgi:hypothetical protein
MRLARSDEDGPEYTVNVFECRPCQVSYTEGTANFPGATA